MKLNYRVYFYGNVHYFTSTLVEKSYIVNGRWFNTLYSPVQYLKRTATKK